MLFSVARSSFLQLGRSSMVAAAGDEEELEQLRSHHVTRTNAAAELEIITAVQPLSALLAAGSASAVVAREEWTSMCAHTASVCLVITIAICVTT